MGPSAYQTFADDRQGAMTCQNVSYSILSVRLQQGRGGWLVQSPACQTLGTLLRRLTWAVTFLEGLVIFPEGITTLALYFLQSQAATGA